MSAEDLGIRVGALLSKRASMPFRVATLLLAAQLAGCGFILLDEGRTVVASDAIPEEGKVEDDATEEELLVDAATGAVAARMWTEGEDDTAADVSVAVNVEVGGSASGVAGSPEGAFAIDGALGGEAALDAELYASAAGVGGVDSGAVGVGGVDSGAVGAGGAEAGSAASGDADMSALPPEVRVETGPGVRALPELRRAAELGDLAGVGVAVDGVQVQLEDLVAGFDDLELEWELVGEGVSIATEALVRADGSVDVGVVVRQDGARTRQVPAGMRVHLVLDASSSMQRSWGQVVEAVLDVAGELGPRDAIEIVGYAGESRTLLPMTPASDAEALAAGVRAALGDATLGGGTNLEAGLRAAYDSAARDAGRDAAGQDVVLVVTDGVPTRGAMEAQALGQIAGQARRSCGARTSTIGVGDSFDPAVLRQVARGGGGRYLVADGGLEVELSLELRAAMVEEPIEIEVELEIPQDATLEGEARYAATGTQESRSFRVIPGTSGDAGPVTVHLVLPSGRVVEKVVAPVAGALAARATLGNTLELVADHVLNGRGDAAAAELRAVSALPYASLRARRPVLERVARALEVLVSGRGRRAPASHAARRRVALALGGLAFSLGR